MIDIFQDQQSLLSLIKTISFKGRLAHAYLIIGDDDEINEAVTSWWAKLLLCHKPFSDNMTDLPCGYCKNCKMMEAKCHPDFISIQPDGQFLKIDAIRQLQHSISLKPMEGARQVCVVHRADKMTLEAANAFLKTLEEPPSQVVLLLTAASTSEIMPTILSRCQLLKCSKLTEQRLMELIKNHLSFYKMKTLPEEQIRFLAAFSEGSFADAKKIIHYDLLSIREAILKAITSPKHEAIPTIFEISNELDTSPEQLLLAARILRSIVKDILLIQNNTNPSHILNSDHLDGLKWLANSYSQDFLDEYTTLLEHTETFVKRNVDKELLTESLLLFWHN